METCTDKYLPNGDPTVGYPQIFIRTNRCDGRTNIEDVVKIADEAASQYPEGDPARAKAVIKVLTDQFGGGAFGHAWITVFKNDKQEYTTYSYHADVGYTKNGVAPTNDTPERRYHSGYSVKIDDYDAMCQKIEKNIVPVLNLLSAVVGWAMGMEASLEKGSYTPMTNCSWFAGLVWKMAVGYPFDSPRTFEQPFDGKAHADNWVMPYLKFINTIADPGMIDETISILEKK